MREIKFRGKPIEDYGKITWFYGSAILDYEDKLAYIQASGQGFVPVEWESVGQYTGLHDKNGKEIYEGDILDCTCELLTNFGRTRTGKMGTTIYEVFWRDEGWRERVIRSDSLVSGKDSDGVAVTAKYSKVIGNIHEHPHLLNQE
ncbi:YopX family protein [Brevibacillus laterosporus]|uniref:YopX family protein n=1 Tax=Brevibacillus laterosporus TaxID=1465 RepID=UPI000E6C5B00|nr:YopX family protein [Brevibacillus laterosporus]AYB38553.1 hypothetical protein D5F52_09930 [Brevibacillus laterosporus]MBM7110737.1 YopX protein [Brevibacillus laterosporus]